MKNFILFIILVIGFLAPSAAMSRTTIVVKNEEYVINGNKFDVLNRQIIELGPKSSFGRSFAGHVGYDVKWSYQLTDSANKCVMESADTAITIKYTIPRWEKPRDVSQEMIDRWNIFYKAMKIHEDGHMMRAIAAANEIDAALNTISFAANCDEMKEKIDATANDIMNKYDKYNKDYDMTTQHGITQGAVFPD